MISDYVEEFLAGNPRHHVVIQLRTGVRRDGTLTAHTVNHVVNSGAYAAFKSYGTIAGANEAAGPYRIPNTRIDSTFVYTNTVPGGFMRAPGEPEGVFAIESHMDEVARAIGMDPVDFRLENLIVEGDETAFGHRLHHVRAIETLRAAVAAAVYDAPKPANVGRGVAIGERGTGAGEGTVEIFLQPDGRAILGTPMFDQGTGTYTTIAQVAGEELGIPPERFELEVWDTDELESDSGLTGSRGTHVNSIAAHQAAQLARRDLVQLAAEYFGWPETEVEFSAGCARRRDGTDSVTWEDLLARTGQPVRARAHTVANRSHLTSFVAQIAEVQVDPETGEIKVLRFTTAHDSGVVLNPLGYQGQVNGGFQHGLGYALMEELVVEDGRVTTLSFGDYKMPTMADMPPLETVILPSEHGEGPYNIRGIGEAPCIPVAPAVANAVADAVGVRIRDLPITAVKVYRGMTAARP
jgi:carbon-monoxide dehydrogenase large subunit